MQETLKDPGAVALLGGALTIRVQTREGEEVWEFPEPENLYYAPGERTLILVIGRTVNFGDIPSVQKNKKAAAYKIFERWSAREVENAGTVDIPAVKLKDIGKAVDIIYRSDKWHKKRNQDYIHSFTKKNDNVRVRCGTFRGGKVVTISGGRMTVTERGIIY